MTLPAFFFNYIKLEKGMVINAVWTKIGFIEYQEIVEKMLTDENVERIGTVSKCMYTIVMREKRCDQLLIRSSRF